MKSLATDSSVHGLKFIFDSSRNKFVRIFWSLIFVSSFTGLCIYLNQIRIKWHESPDIFSIERGRALDDFPAPALTFCPNVFTRNNLANFSDIHVVKNYSESTCKFLFANIQRLENPLGNKVFDACSKFTLIDTVKALDESSFENHEIFGQCFITLNSKENFQINCEKIITRVLTDIGFCFSFNLQNFDTIFNSETIHKDFYYKNVEILSKNESLHNLQDDNWAAQKELSKKSIYPYKANKDFSLKFNMILNESDEVNLFGYGIFTVFIHPSNEFPTESHIKLNAFKELSVLHDINIISDKTNEELRRYTPDLRKCYFEDERKLYYFKSYTKAHCEFECQSNWTLNKCGCVKFSMPRNESIRVCGPNDIKCYQFYYPEYLEESLLPCNCYQLCNAFSYGVNYTNFFNIYFESKELSKQGRKAFKGQFGYQFKKMNIVLETERFASYKLINLIADIGGLLGLFLGCSILSIIEILYLATGWLKPSPEDPDEIDHLSQELSETLMKLEYAEKRLRRHENSKTFLEDRN